MLRQMSADLALQLDLAIRLLLAAVLGAVVGLEREIHDHPAGMRTHLLVSLGSAAFTVLSMTVLGAVGDPGRVAAQVVTGVGFLGAGAILKEGATIRGLTTAASLWAVAAVGMAAGAGGWGVALIVTVIAVFSLWPLGRISDRFVGRERHRLRLQLVLTEASVLRDVAAAVAEHGASVLHLATRPSPRGGIVVDLDARLPDTMTSAGLVAALAAIEGTELDETAATGD
jgi:putative Mg2+ transporter-C (MgtC) family protein